MRAMRGTEGAAYTMILVRRKLGYGFNIDGPLDGDRGEPSSFPQASCCHSRKPAVVIPASL